MLRSQQCSLSLLSGSQRRFNSQPSAAEPAVTTATQQTGGVKDRKPETGSVSLCGLDTACVASATVTVEQGGADTVRRRGPPMSPRPCAWLLHNNTVWSGRVYVRRYAADTARTASGSAQLRNGRCSRSVLVFPEFQKDKWN